MTAMDMLTVLGESREEWLDAALDRTPRKGLSRGLRMGLIAAAVVVLLSLAALAVNGGLMERIFPERFDEISDFVSREAVTVENEMLRLTVHEAVTDGFSAVMFYSIQRLDGGSMEGWSPDDEITPLNSQGDPIRLGGSWGDEYITGEETEDRRWFVWYAYDRTDLAGITMRLFGLVDRTTGEKLDAGSLRATVELTPCPVKTAERRGDPEARELYPFITLSPLSLRIEAYVNQRTLEDGYAPPKNRVVNGEPNCTVLLRYRDGSEEDLTEMLRRRPGAAAELIVGTFPELIDLDRAKALVIDGVVYPLQAGEQHIRTGPSETGLEAVRAWTYGDHTPTHPELRTAENGVTLALDGIWTDGYTAELCLAYDDEAARGELILPAHQGGLLRVSAYDASGAPLAAGLRLINSWDLVAGLAVECAGKAASITLSAGGAELTIPLDMKALQKLPQTVPKEAEPRKTWGPDNETKLYQSACDSLFAGVEPDDTGYTADNGEYTLSFEYVYARAEKGKALVRVLGRYHSVSGEKLSLSVDGNRFTVAGITAAGEECILSGAAGFQGWFEKERTECVFQIDWDDYGNSPGLAGFRITWTPPDGARISIDVPLTDD